MKPALLLFLGSMVLLTGCVSDPSQRLIKKHEDQIIRISDTNSMVEDMHGIAEQQHLITSLLKDPVSGRFKDMFMLNIKGDSRALLGWIRFRHFNEDAGYQRFYCGPSVENYWVDEKHTGTKAYIENVNKSAGSMDRLWRLAFESAGQKE